MGKHKDFVAVSITIEQAVKAIVRDSGDNKDTVINALANYILLKGFQVSYKKYTITIPNQKSVHVECYLTTGAVSKYLFEVAEKGWEGVFVDPKFCESITKIKDGEMIIERGTKFEKKVPKNKKYNN